MRVGTCQLYASTQPLGAVQGVQAKLAARAKELQGKIMFARHSSFIQEEAAPTSSGGDIEGEDRESKEALERSGLALCLQGNNWAHRDWPAIIACTILVALQT